MARGTNKLSALQIKSALKGKLQDGGGLILNKKSKDSGKWVFRYSFAGRRRDMGLGSWPDVSLAEARKLRDGWRAEITLGNDPVSEREKRQDQVLKEMDREDPTFEAMTEITFEAMKSDLRGDGENGRWLSPLKIHIHPKIGRTRISKLRPIDIRDAMQAIWRDKPETARKAFTRTRMVIDKAERTEFEVYPNLMAIAEEMLGRAPARSNKPTVSTDWQDLPQLYEKLRWDYASHLALKFLILTAVRTDAIRGARFAEIDGDVWTVPKERVKGHKAHAQEFRVPLSSEALRIVAYCREYRTSDMLFPSPRGNGTKGLSENAMLNALNNLGEQGRPHGMRASFKTWSKETRAGTWEATETALSHVIGNKTERAYDRSDLLDERRILMQKWADFVTRKEAKIVPLHGRS